MKHISGSKRWSCPFSVSDAPWSSSPASLLTAKSWRQKALIEWSVAASGTEVLLTAFQPMRKADADVWGDSHFIPHICHDVTAIRETCYSVRIRRLTCDWLSHLQPGAGLEKDRSGSEFGESSHACWRILITVLSSETGRENVFKIFITYTQLFSSLNTSSLESLHVRG